MNVPAYKGKLITLLLCITATLTLCTCDAIFEDEGDCTTHFKVEFTYDRNMHFADAFAHEVKQVTLYIFDMDGKLVRTQSESGAVLAQDGYLMDVDIKPDTYTLVAWAEGWETGSTYTYSELQPGVSDLEELNCRLNRQHDADGTAYIDEDISPLYHAISYNECFCELIDGGESIISLNLTKNTNNVRVILQHLSGEDVNADDFTFSITDANGHMDYDNSLLPDETLTYRAWDTYSGSAGINAPTDTRDAVTSVSVAIAELTTGRLMADGNPILTVKNKEGETVLSIPLVDYALLVKGNYNRDMDDQEYLDRQDEYNLTFFLDDDDRWVSSSIIINSWTVVLQDVGI